MCAYTTAASYRRFKLISIPEYSSNSHHRQCIVYMSIEDNIGARTLLAGKLKFSINSNPASGFLDVNVALNIDGSVTISDVAAAVHFPHCKTYFPWIAFKVISPCSFLIS
jgi:hypothetical protein